MTARRRSLFFSALVLVPALAAAAPPALGAQDPPQAAAGESSAPNALKEVDAALAARKTPKEEAKSAADERLTKAVDTLTADFSKYDEKTKKEVVDTLGRIFAVRTNEDDDRIYLVAAAALSDMGPDAEAPLLRALKLKHIEKKPETRANIVESLGKFRNPKNIDMFIGLLNESDTKIVVASIQSLGEFKDADAKIRKEVAEALVKQYANANSLDVKEKGKNPVFHQRLIDIEQPMNDALEKVTLQTLKDAPAWEKWFNDNRNKKW